MLSAQKLRSEVDRLLAEIRAEHKAVENDVTGLAHHAGYNVLMMFGMDHLHTLQRQLCDLVGDAATALIAEELKAGRHQMVSNQPQTPVTSSVTLSDLLDMTYSPELLLESHLDVSITGDADFSDACKWGFLAFLNEVESGDGGPFTQSEVRARVCREMLEVLSSEDQVSLAWYVGFMLGWLSTLALVQRDEALAGLNELLSLMDQLQ